MGGGGETKEKRVLLECEPVAWKGVGARWRYVVGWASVTGFCCVFHVLVVWLVLIPATWVGGWRKWSVCLMAGWILASVWPQREWEGARRLGQLWYELFKMRHNVDEETAARLREMAVTDQFILGMHPHGIVPIQAILWCAYCDQYMLGPNGKTLYGFGGIASVLCRLPLLRTLLGWLAATPATFGNLERGLKRGKNLYILPGGLAEIFTAKPGSDVVVWRRRRGLCKLALVTGARLVPLYVFGGNDFFDQLLTSDSFLARLSRKFRVSLTVFWGTFFLPVPFPADVALVLAEPLPATKAAIQGKPSDAEIDHLHRLYEHHLRDAFDSYKALAGRPHASLKVI